MPLVLVFLLVALPGLALAAEKPVPIKLINPGFEEGAEPWVDPADATLAAAASRDTDAFRAGKASLHMLINEQAQWPTVSQEVEGLEAGARYALRVWYRGLMDGQGSAALRVEFLDAAGKVLGGQHLRRPAREERWQQLIVEAEAPEGTVRGQVHLRLMGADELWFDDVEMLRTRAAPALVARPARLAFVAGTAGKASLTVTSSEDLTESVQATLTALGPNAKSVPLTGALVRQDARTLSGEVSFAALPAGTTVWRAKVAGKTAEGRFFATPASRQPTNLNERGAVQVGGKSLFPIGIYHAAASDYPLLYERGFNAVQGVGSNDSALARAAVSQAEQAKLAVEMPLHFAGLVGANLLASQQKISFFAKAANVLGWMIADEPDQHQPIMDEVPEVYVRLKQKESLRPLGLTVTDAATFGYWAHFCDTLTVPAFPLPGQPLTLVSERIAAARQALQPWQPVWALLQAGWLPGGSNQPNLQRARVMVHLAIINGARGIFWYAMRDPGWQLVETPLWGQFKELNQETERLGEVALSGDPVTLESDRKQAQLAGWLTGTKLKIMVANPEQTAETVTVKLPHAATGAEAGKGGVQAEIKEGALVLTLEPLGAGLVTVE